MSRLRCVGFRFAGQAEQTFADDVALHLARAAGDPPAGCAEHAVGIRPEDHGVGTGDVAAQHRRVERHVGDPQLHQRGGGRRDRTLSLGHRLERGAPTDERGELLSFDRVELALITELGHARQPALEPDHRRADVPALAGEDRHPDAPSAVERAEEMIGGQGDIGEEHLVELGLTGHLLQRSYLDAGQVHRAEEERDALVLRSTVRSGRIEGAGTRHQDAPVAVAPARTPHLLTVQEVVVTVEFGPGRQRSEVAAGPRLGEQLAPHVVGLERGPQVLLLLLGRAEALDRPAGEHETDHVEKRGDPGPCALEHPDAVVLDA